MGTLGFNGREISGCGTPQHMGRRLDEILGFLSRMETHLQAVIADVQIRTRLLYRHAAVFQTARQCEAGPIEVVSLCGRQRLYCQWPTWQRSLAHTFYSPDSNISPKMTLRQQMQCTDAIACLAWFIASTPCHHTCWNGTQIELPIVLHA